MTGLIQDGIDRDCDRSPALGGSALRRKLRFVLVGTTCFVLQYAVLRSLSGAGMARPVANGVGFVLSAQANFLLSSVFTWADRAPGEAFTRDVSPRRLNANRRRWVSYNGTAAVALAVNTIVFAAADRIVDAMPAALAGVGAGTVVTYLICDRLIFATETTGATVATESLQESLS